MEGESIHPAIHGPRTLREVGMHLEIGKDST
jgi:hypothetical protein